MPQINEYTAQTDVLRPSETGVEAQAMAGRRAGAFYDQAARSIKESSADQARAAQGIAAGTELEARAFSGVAKSVAEAGDQAVTYETHREISHGAATYAQIVSDVGSEWNSIVSDPNTDPNDRSVAGKFRETVLEPKLDQFTQSFGTMQAQQWAESHVEALRNHMFEKQTADMSKLASDAVAVNAEQTRNRLANAARDDPSALPFLLKVVDSSTAHAIASSPNLKGIDAANLHSQLTQKDKEELVKSAAMGAAEKSDNPEAAVAEVVKRYPQYIKPGEADQLAKSARYFGRMNESGAKAAEAEQKRQATAAFHKDANQWELSTIDDSGNAVLPPDAVKQLKDMVTKYGGNADPGRVTSMVHRVQELGKTLDPSTAANLRKRSDTTMRDLYGRPEGLPAPEEINQLYAKDQITYADRNRAIKDYQDDRSPDGQTLAKARSEFFTRFASTFDPSRDPNTGAGASALGNQKIGEAQAEARRMEGVLRSQGKDPHLLYQQGSPEFFGNDENISQFRPTMQERLQYDMQRKADEARKGAPAAPGPKFTPPSNWQFSPSRQQYRDPNGRTYDLNGKPTASLQGPAAASLSQSTESTTISAETDDEAAILDRIIKRQEESPKLGGANRWGDEQIKDVLELKRILNERIKRYGGHPTPPENKENDRLDVPGRRTF